MKALLIRKTTTRQRRWISPDGTPRSAWLFELLVESEDGSRKIRRSGFPDRATAKEAARLEVHNLRTEAKRAPATLTLHKILEDYRDNGLSHLSPRGRSTEEGNLRIVLARVPDLPLSKVSPAVPEGLVARRRKEEVSVFAIRREVQALDRAVSRAVRNGDLASNPLRPLPRLKTPKLDPVAPTPEEVQRLLDHSQGWLRVAVALASSCGLRKQEILHLRWCDLDAKRGALRVAASEAFTPKGKCGRTVPVPASVARLLEAWRESEDVGGSPLVFPKSPGSTLPRTRFDAPWVALKTRAGVECRFHSLRHHFAMEAARKGAAPAALQSALGHQSLATTGVYLRGSDRFSLDVAAYAPTFRLDDSPDPEPPAPETSAAVVELVFEKQAAEG